jgi:CRISPR-associated helicase Cas3/CRISPR-associated endonuclease Cas3-HD
MYIAHIRESDKEEQPLIDHLNEAEKLCREFANDFNSGDFAACCGKLHDTGKYSDEFQKRIRGLGKKCDHSTAGARIIIDEKPFGKIAAYCIAGHHSGLLDAGSSSDCEREGTLYSRLSSENIKKLPSYDNYKTELDISSLKLMPDKSFCKKILQKDKNCGFIFSFFTRMIYSCLTDADFIDTERFMNPNSIRKNDDTDFKILLEKLNNKLSGFEGKDGLVNLKRNEILDSCKKSANSDRGLFTLTVPTGGGKTLSSMAFALNHLLRNEMKRIIYVIPYTSIIEQNAKVFKDIFGNECVLEHHSNYDFENSEDTTNDYKKLAAENWDMPVIITTNVQFFESLFANKSSKCRKLHNIANSVIIFDEAQMLPLNYLEPCVAAISELIRGYKCTAVLCSATQPALQNIFPRDIDCKEICPNTKELFEVFKRTNIANKGELSNEELVYEINKLNQCLTIVNTRKHALELFSLLSGDGIYHLSTLMCPFHRKEVIEEIKKRLHDKLPCKVVSTQLIEAGVDVDFPVVYRSLCGLDSLIQSAGRCNREGKLADINGNKINGIVYSFKAEEKYYKHQPLSLKKPINLTDEISRHFDDISSPEAIKDFFEKLYHHTGEDLDKKKIMQELNKGFHENPQNYDECFNYNFKWVADSFKLIEENTYSIIIPFNDKAKALIEKLNHIENLKGVMRSLQQYTVNVYLKEYDSLNGMGKLNVISENTAILRSMDDYDEYKGINVELSTGNAVFM